MIFKTFTINLLIIPILTSIAQLWLPSQNLSLWYRPIDLCMLSSPTSSESNVSNSVELKMKECEKKKPLQELKLNMVVNDQSFLPLPPMRCRVGNTWPSRSEFCSGEDIPFHQRSNFRNAVIGFDDPTRFYLHSFFRKLGKHKGALLLIGDSVMQQFFNAIACELERENVWKDPKRFTNTDEVQYVKVNGSSKTRNETLVPIKFLPIYHFVDGRWDRVVNASMHALENTIHNILHSYTNKANPDIKPLFRSSVKTLVIVVNMGLHYVDNPVTHFSRADYISQMTMALKYLHHQVVLLHPHKKIFIFWRETTAQHFPTFNGYWPGAKFANTIQFGCSPIKDPSLKADWRNRDIEEIIDRHHLFSIKIIPFYNLTVPLWSEHPNGHLKDCTHFCWTPMLYQPVFHYLNQAINT